MPATKVGEQLIVAGDPTPQPMEDIALTREAVQLVGAANAFYPGLAPQDQEHLGSVAGHPRRRVWGLQLGQVQPLHQRPDTPGGSAGSTQESKPRINIST